MKKMEVCDLAHARSLINVSQAFAEATETLDGYSIGHQRRVAKLSEAICYQLNLSEEETTAVAFAAAVHDVGKIAVPGEILRRPSSLSGPEWGLVKVHASAGYDLLNEGSFEFPIAEYVLQHHERLNGCGYPRGLRGEEILLGARIIAVADALEVIVSGRQYQEAKTIEEALSLLENSVPDEFDRKVMDACSRAFAAGFEFGQEVTSFFESR